VGTNGKPARKKLPREEETPFKGIGIGGGRGAGEKGGIGRAQKERGPVKWGGGRDGRKGRVSPDEWEEGRRTRQKRNY